MSTPAIGNSPQPNGASGSPAAVTILRVLSRTDDEVVAIVRLQNDGREGVATFNRKTSEGTVIIGNTTMNVDVHDTARSLNRQEFDRNYTAPPPPPPPPQPRGVDPLIADMNRNGFEAASNSVYNRTGTKEYLNSINSQGSGDAMLVYRDATGRIQQFRDAIEIINGEERRFDNAFQHLQALMDKNGDGTITGSELDHVLFQFADGRLVLASDPSLNIQSIDTSYAEVNRQNGLVRQANDAGITFKDGTRIALGNIWPAANTLESVNAGINPTGNTIVNVHSTGNTIDDLAFAAAKNPLLKSHIEGIQADVRAGNEISSERWDHLIKLWAGVSEVTGDRFGVENWKIEALRRFLSEDEGRSYGQVGHGVQNQQAATELNGKFQGFVDQVKLVFVGRVRTQTEVAPVYNIEFDSSLFSTISSGQTVSVNKDKLAVGSMGQFESDGGAVINFRNGRILGIFSDGRDVYGRTLADHNNLREEKGARLSHVFVRETAYQDGIVRWIGKSNKNDSRTDASNNSTQINNDLTWWNPPPTHMHIPPTRTKWDEDDR